LDTRGTPTAPAAPAAALEYKVQRGDTLSAIASRNGISLSALRQANQLSGDSIRVGQKLLIPRS